MSRFSCAAVLFDLDGVLVDSMHLVRKLWRVWAVERGLDPGAVSAASKGGPGIETLRIIDPTLDVEAEAKRLSALEHSFVKDVTVMPGALEILGELSALGVPWGIVTSGTLEVARGRIDHCALPEPQVLVTADHVTRGKPHPEPYVTGAGQLGVSAELCLVLEDSPGGIRAGRAAGATVVGLAGSHPPGRLAEAHYVVERFGALDLVASTHGIDVTVQAVG